MKHPRQPLYIDNSGVVRFKGNAIVEWLFKTRRIDLNEISMRGFPSDDLAQFWQLLGYSASGYGELSFIPEEIVAEIDAQAEVLLDEAKRR